MPDIAGAVAHGRTVLDSVFTDTGTVSRDPDQLDDATYDPATMRAGQPADSSTVWSGRCIVFAAGTPEQQIAPQTPIAVPTYRALLPYDAPEIRRGDVLTVDTSSDPLLIGKALWVHSVETGSIVVARALNVSTERPR